MNNHTQKNHPHMPQDNPMLIVSSDGYIRLTHAELSQETLIHLISGLDENTEHCHDSLTDITGYTEWVTDNTPTISMGWDCQLGSTTKPEQLIRISEIRSNIMLHNHEKIELGVQKTNEFLEIIIEKFNWQTLVRAHIYQRYRD